MGKTFVLLALVLLSPLPFASPLDLMGGSGDQRAGLPALGPPPAYAHDSSPMPPYIESVAPYFGPDSTPLKSVRVNFNSTLDPATVEAKNFAYDTLEGNYTCYGFPGRTFFELIDGNNAVHIKLPFDMSAGSTYTVGHSSDCGASDNYINDTNSNQLHIDDSDFAATEFAAADPTAISAVETSATLITARIIADGIPAEYVNATSNPASAFVVEGRTVSSWEIADNKTIRITVSGAGDAGITRSITYAGGAGMLAGTEASHFAVPDGISGSAPDVGFSAARTGPDTIRLDFETAGLPARSLSGNESTAPFSLSAGTVDGWSVSGPTPALSPFNLDWPDSVYPALGSDEEFGAAVASIGDIDSNGASDYAVGARSTGSSNNGSVYIIRMADNNGAVLGVTRIAHTDVADPPGEGSGFGSALAGLGPLAAGGLPAVAVGAPHSGNAGTPGLVYVIFLSPNGTVDSSARFDREDSTTSDNSNNDRFGAALAAAGDRNGDGVPDLWVGAPRATTFTDGGLVLALLNNNGTAIDVADGTNWVPTNQNHRNRYDYNEADYFGSAIADIGDVNGDGNGDIAVGVPSSAGGSSGLRIVLLGPDHNLTDPVGIGRISDNTDLYGGGDGNGVSLAGIGDANGDGIPDVAVGSSRSNGYFSIVYLDSSGEISSFDDIRRNAAGFDPIRSDAQFGASLAHIGDINGDGVPDLLVGSPRQHGAADDSGSVSFVSAYATPSISLEVSGLDGAAAPTVSYDAGIGDVSSEAYDASFLLDDASVPSDDRLRPSLVTATASGSEVSYVFSEPLNATGLRPAGFAAEGFEVQSAAINGTNSSIAIATLNGTTDGSDPVLSVTAAVQDAAGNAAVPRAGALSELDPVPVLNGLTITSDNDNDNKLAKAGDTLTVTISYRGLPLSSITGTIAGIDAVAGAIGATEATVTALVAEGTDNGAAKIDLVLSNAYGSDSAVTANLTGDNVIVDTKPPVLYPSFLTSDNPADDSYATSDDNLVGNITVVGTTKTGHIRVEGSSQTTLTFFVTQGNDPTGVDNVNVSIGSSLSFNDDADTIRIASLNAEDDAGNVAVFLPSHENYTGHVAISLDNVPPEFSSASYAAAGPSVSVQFNDTLYSADASKYMISYNDTDGALIEQEPASASVSGNAATLVLADAINATGSILVSLEQGAARDRANHQSVAAANQMVSTPNVSVYTTGNPGYAKAGDNIMVSVGLDGAPDSYAGTIAGAALSQQNFSLSDDGLTLNATITVSSGLPQGPVAFEINATKGSAVATYTQADVSGEGVTIDTVLPVLYNATFYTDNGADTSYLNVLDTITGEISLSEDGPDFDIVLSGPAAGTISGVSRDETGYASASQQIAIILRDGPVGISFTVSDYAGNSVAFAQGHDNFTSTTTVDSLQPAFSSAAYSSARPLLLTVEFNDILTSADASLYTVSYDDPNGDPIEQVPASASVSGDTATLVLADAINATGDVLITLEIGAARDRGDNPSMEASNRMVSTSGVTISTTGNPGYAKAGDNITVTIALEYAPATWSGTLAGQDIAQDDFAVVGQTTLVATITVQEGFDQGEASFDINITGAGGPTRATQANLTGASITIDTIAPDAPTVLLNVLPDDTVDEIGLDSALALTLDSVAARWTAAVNGSQTLETSGPGIIINMSADISAPYEGPVHYNVTVYDAAGNNNTGSGDAGYADLLRPAPQNLTLNYGNLSTVLVNYDEEIADADPAEFTVTRTRAGSSAGIPVTAASPAGAGSSSVNLTLGSELQDGDAVFVAGSASAVSDAARNGPSLNTLSASVTVPVNFVYAAVRNGTDSIVLSFMVNGTPVQSLGTSGDVAGAFALDSGSADSASASDPLFAQPEFAIDWPAAGNFSLSENDRFGSGAAVIGDIDSNGAQDYAIGIFDGANRDGAVYIFRMADSRTVLGATKIPYSDIAGLAAGQWFSKAIAGLGPLSEGGLPALAVSAPRTGNDRGQVYVMFLNPNGTLASHATLDTASISNLDNNDDERLGWSLAAAGDRNNDTVPDLWVGAPYADDGEDNRGIVYLAYLNANGTAIDQTDNDNQLGGRTNVLNVDDNDLFGISVADIGDINGDNRSDIAVGMVAGSDDNKGQIRVILTGDNADLSNGAVVASLADGDTGVPQLAANDRFGWAVAGIGDVNYDGIPDIAASDRVGSIHVLLMNDDGTISSSYAIASDAAGLSPAIDSDGDFGFSLAHIGDIDSDGVPELLAGSQNHDAGAPNTGAASIISVLATPRLVLGTSGVTGSAATPAVSYDAGAGARITANYTGVERALEGQTVAASDGVRPALVSAETLSPEIVRATFDEPLSEGSLVAGAFLVAGQAAVSAEIDPDNENAALVRAAGTIGNDATPLVNATGAQDASGNAANSTGVNASSGFVAALAVTDRIFAVAPGTVVADPLEIHNIDKTYAKAGDVLLLQIRSLPPQPLTVGDGGATMFGQPVTNVTSYNDGSTLIFNYTVQPGQNSVGGDRNLPGVGTVYPVTNVTYHVTDGNFQEIIFDTPSTIGRSFAVDTAPPNMTRVTSYDGHMIAEFDEFLSASSLNEAGFTSVPALGFSAAELADGIEDLYAPGPQQIGNTVNLTVTTGSYDPDTTYSVTATAAAAADPAGNPSAGVAVDSLAHDAAGFSASHPRQGIITLNFTHLNSSAAVSFANNDPRAFSVGGGEVLSWQASNAAVSTDTLASEARDFGAAGPLLLGDGSFAGGAIVLNNSEDNRLVLLSNPAGAGSSLNSSYGIATVGVDGITEITPYGAQNHTISNEEGRGLSIGHSAALLGGINLPAGAEYAVALGAPGLDTGQTDRTDVGGAVISFFGPSGLKVGNDTVVAPYIGPGQRIGFYLDSARLNGDNTTDLIIGSRHQIDSPVTHIYYLNADGTLSSRVAQAGIASGAYIGEFGGFKHVAGADPAANAVRVYALSADGTGFGPLATTITASSLGLHAGALGEVASVAGPGDLDGDGNADLVIGARAANGSVIIAYLDENASPVRAVSIDAHTPGGPAGADRPYPGAALFPYRVSAGDLNGDGTAEIFASIIGAPGPDGLEYSASNITHDQAAVYAISVSEGTAGHGRIYAQGLGASDSPDVSYDDGFGTALAAGGLAVPDGAGDGAEDRSAPRLEGAFRNGSIFLLDYNENVTVPSDAVSGAVGYYMVSGNAGGVTNVTAAGQRVTLETSNEEANVMLSLGEGAASDEAGNRAGPTAALAVQRYFAPLSAEPLSAIHILVSFSATVDPDTVSAGSFAVDGGVNITSARLFDNSSVVLGTTPLSDGREYAVTVSGVRENMTGASPTAETVGTGEFRALARQSYELSVSGLGNDDRFGNAIAVLGDVNGDGVPDLATGAPRDGPGAVYILFMGADGQVASQARIDSPLTSGGNSQRFGFSVAGPGDVNGDGVPDLAVGAIRGGDGNTDGSVTVFMLRADGTAMSYSAIDRSDAGLPPGTIERFGAALAAPGDLDGDGVPDLVTSSVDAFSVGADTLVALLLNADGSRKSNVTIASNADVGLDGNAEFGWSVAPLGDIDGNGGPDFAVGSYALQGMMILRLDSSLSLGSYTQITPAQAGLHEFDYLGYSAAAIGDLDGDGITEIAVGAPGSADQRENMDAQGVHIVSVDSQGALKWSYPAAVRGDADVGPLRDDDLFGSAVAAVPDYDGNGLPDLAVGASSGIRNSGGLEGAVHIVSPFLDQSVTTVQGVSSDSSGKLGASTATFVSVEFTGPVKAPNIGDVLDLNVAGQASFSHQNGNTLLFQYTTDASHRANGLDTDGINAFQFPTSRLQPDTGPPVIAILPVPGSAGSLSDNSFIVLGDFAPAKTSLTAEPDGLVGLGQNATITLVTNTVLTSAEVSVLDDPVSDERIALSTTRVPDDTITITYTAKAGDAGPLNFSIKANSDGESSSFKETDLDDPSSAPVFATGTLRYIAATIDPEDSTRLILSFSADIDSATVAPGDFTVAGRTVDSVRADKNLVYLELDGAVTGGTVSISGEILDTAGNPISSGSANASGFVATGARALSATAILVEYSSDIDTDTVTGNYTINGSIGIRGAFASGPDSVTLLVSPLSDGQAYTVTPNIDAVNGSDGARAPLIGAETVPFAALDASYVLAPDGLDDGDSFSSSVAAIGDVDGDGIVDMAAGARRDGDSGSNAGAVYVMLMTASGSVREYVKIANPDTSAGANDFFGSAVVPLGDLDGDGVPDIAVGAPGFSSSRGLFYVMFLNDNGTMRDNVRHRSNTLGAAGNANSNLGASMTAVTGRSGAFDGTTVFFALFGSASNSKILGSVDLEPDGRAVSSYSPHATGTTVSVESSATLAFASLAPFVDLDGDGGTEILSGGPTYDSNEGRIFIHYFDGAGMHDRISVIRAADLGLTGRTSIGTSLDVTGDLDGDGIPEILVGGAANRQNSNSEGTNYQSVSIVSVDRDGAVRWAYQIDPDTGGINASGSLLDIEFGGSVASLPDYDGNGLPDLAIGESVPIGGVNSRNPPGQLYMISPFLDGSVITVKNVTATSPSGQVRAGAFVGIGVEFTGPVGEPVGGSTISLNTGGSAPHNANPEGDTIGFLYQVRNEDSQPSLDYAGIGALSFSGDSIRADGGPLTLANLPYPGSAGSLSANSDIIAGDIKPQRLSLNVTSDGLVAEDERVAIRLVTSTSLTNATVDVNNRTLAKDVDFFIRENGGLPNDSVLVQYNAVAGDTGPLNFTINATSGSKFTVFDQKDRTDEGAVIFDTSALELTGAAIHSAREVYVNFNKALDNSTVDIGDIGFLFPGGGSIGVSGTDPLNATAVRVTASADLNVGSPPQLIITSDISDLAGNNAEKTTYPIAPLTAITVSGVRIYGDNAFNPAYARVGTTLTVNMTLSASTAFVSGNIAGVSIDNSTVSYDSAGTTLTATAVIPEAPNSRQSDGAVDFSITLSSALPNFAVTQTELEGDGIELDTAAPSATGISASTVDPPLYLIPGDSLTTNAGITPSDSSRNSTILEAYGVPVETFSDDAYIGIWPAPANFTEDGPVQWTLTLRDDAGNTRAYAHDNSIVTGRITADSDKPELQRIVSTGAHTLIAVFDSNVTDVNSAGFALARVGPGGVETPIDIVSAIRNNEVGFHERVTVTTKIGTDLSGFVQLTVFPPAVTDLAGNPVRNGSASFGEAPEIAVQAARTGQETVILDFAIGGSAVRQITAQDGGAAGAFTSSMGTVESWRVLPAGLVPPITHIDSANSSIIRADRTYAQFGAAVEAIGDLDGNGAQDYIASSRRPDSSDPQSGALHVVLMADNYTILNVTRTLHGALDDPPAPASRLGDGLASLGPLEPGGLHAVAAGAPNGNEGGGDAGEVHILFFNTDGTLNSSSRILAASVGHTSGNEDYFGRSVASVPGAGGEPRLLIGAPGAGSGGAGRAFVANLSASGAVTGAATTIEISGGSSGDQFGISVSQISGAGGDGIADIIVGARGEGDGAIYIMRLHANGSVLSTTKLDENTDNMPSTDNSEEFGRAVSGVIGPDGRHTGDVIVGSGANGGTAYVIRLDSSGAPAGHTAIYRGTAGGPAIPGNDDGFAFSLAPIGDIDSDGVPEFMSGTINHNGADTASGRVYFASVSPSQSVELTVSGLTGTGERPVITYDPSVTNITLGSIPLGAATVTSSDRLGPQLLPSRVASPTSVAAAFSEPLKISAIPGGAFRINATAAEEATVSGSTVLLRPNIDLEIGQTARVSLVSAHVQDMSGNAAALGTENASALMPTGPPVPGDVRISSSGNAGYAKAGDTITLDIAYSGAPVTSVSGTIAGITVTQVSLEPAVRVTVQAAENTPNGNASIALTLRNADGNTPVTAADLDNANVVIDTADPQLVSAEFYTNNAVNSAFARYGDNIMLNFTLNEDVVGSSYRITIDGSFQAHSVTAGPLSAQTARVSPIPYPISYDPTGPVGFTLEVRDPAGNTATFTQAHANSMGTVTADNTPPGFSTATYSNANLSRISVMFNDTLSSADPTKYTISYNDTSDVLQQRTPTGAAASGRTVTLGLAEDVNTENGAVQVSLAAGAASDRAGNPSQAISDQTATLEARPLPLDVSIDTSNANSGYARAGDTITVTILLGGVPNSYSGTIAGQTLEGDAISLDGLTLTGRITVQPGTDTDAVAFSFDMENFFGADSASQDDLAEGTNIEIDTIRPPAPVVDVELGTGNDNEIGLDTIITLRLDSDAFMWNASVTNTQAISNIASSIIAFSSLTDVSPRYEGEMRYTAYARDEAGNARMATGPVGYADLIRPNATGITLRPSEPTQISVKFDEEISAALASGFAVTTDDNSNTNSSVTVSGAEITGSGRDIVQLALARELAADSNAYVTVVPAAARDAARNAPAGTVAHGGSLSGFDVVSAKAESATTVLVTFAVELLPASVGASNFALSLQDIGVNSAAPSGRTVLLTTDADINATLPLNLTVSGLIEDADRTTEAANKQYVVVTDYVPPMLNHVRHSSASTVQVGFDEAVDSASISAENFRLNAGAVISAAANGPSNATLTVRTDGGQRVTVTASNILDVQPGGVPANGQGQSSSLQAASSYAESLPGLEPASTGSNTSAVFKPHSESGGALTTSNDKLVQITVPARGSQPSYTVTVVLPSATYSPVGGSDAGAIPVYAGSGRIPASVADPEAARDASIGDPNTDYMVGNDEAIRVTISSSGLADPVAYYIPSDGRAAGVDSCTEAPYSEQANAYDTTNNAGANLAAIGDVQSCYTNSSSTYTIWSNHMTTFGVSERGRPQPSGGDDCSDCQSPTLGRASSGAQLVSGGFSFNGRTVDVGRYHTPSPLITTSVNATNTVGIKVYENYGPEHVKRVEFALGVPEVGAWYDAEAFIEVWFERAGLGVKEIVIEDPLDVIGDETVSASASAGSCSATLNEDQCMHLQLQFAYREAPAYNTMGVKPVDFAGYAHQFYFNDGIDVTGESLNLPAEIDIAVSHAVDHPQRAGLIHLVQTDRAAGLWTDQYGLVWHIEGGIVKQITVPDHIAPADNVIGQHSGLDRHHPLFEQYRELQHARALETLAEILGTDDTSKALPEPETIVFEEVSGKREGAEFQLRLEIEGQRVAELVKELYG